MPRWARVLTIAVRSATERPSRSIRHTTRVSPAQIAQAGGQLRAGGGGAGGDVGEDAHRPGGGKRIVLQRRILLSGGDPGVADQTHGPTLARGFRAPSRTGGDLVT